MKQLVHQILVAALGVIIPAFSVHAQHDLAGLISAAREHHPQQEQLELIAEGISLKIKEIRGSYLPQTSIGGQATWQSEVTSLPVSLPNINVPTPTQDQYKITLDLQQSLWDGGLNAARKSQALTDRQTEEMSVKTDLLKIEEQVCQLYFNVLIAEKQIANYELLLKDLGARTDITKAAVENGTATRGALLDLRAKELEINQKIEELGQRKLAAISGLKLLTGLNLNSETVFTETGVNTEPGPENKRPELGLLTARQEALFTGEKLIKAKNAPKIGLFATAGYGRPGLNFLARDFSPYFIGGVQLKIPVSHWYTGGQKTELQQIKINQQRIEKQKESFLMATEVQKAGLLAEKQRLQLVLLSDKELIAIREQLLKTAEIQLDNGVITPADYVTELNKLEQARQNLSVHEVQLVQTQQNMRLLMGE